MNAISLRLHASLICHVDAGKAAPMNSRSAVTSPAKETGGISILSRFTHFFVYVFERALPDAYVFALLLTFLGAVLALWLAPHAGIREILTGWYKGVFEIFTFAFQMVMMLATGYALASTRIAHRGLERIASIPQSPRTAIALTVLVSLAASWLNWGLGLVTSALLAREIAKRMRIDFGWLVAAAYSGFVISTEGLSGSIVLSQATHGSALNMVEKATGQILPLSQTVFTRFNIVPLVALVLMLPLVLSFTGPAEQDVIPADVERLRSEDAPPAAQEKGRTLGVLLDQAWWLSLLAAAIGAGALFFMLRENHFSLDLNSVILILFLAGVLLHWRPAAYAAAMRKAGRFTGPLILQYPLYGGLMGMMTATGLAGVFSAAFIRFSTARTLPFFTYLTSLIITLFIPSGGGHWAVQGPFAVPAAQALHASLAGTTMSVAMGESAANMLQPFWVLPILAIAGISMRRVMGFMVITFLVALVCFGLSMLFLLPH
jgi:short-chain fatty acids transporter